MKHIAMLILISSGIILSCKGIPQMNSATELPAISPPERAQTPAVAEDAVSPELSGGEPQPEASEANSGEPVFIDEEPYAEASPEEPDYPGAFEDLLEPVADLAEADQAGVPPDERAFAEALPEPPAVLPELPAQAPEPEPPAEPARAVETAQENQALPPTPPSAAQPVPPAPPPIPAAPPPAPSVPPPTPAVPPSPVPVPSAPAAEPKPEQSPSPPRFIRPAEEETPPPVAREPVPLPVQPVPEPPAVAPLPIPEDEGIVFSRVVRATVGQLVEVPFRGTGWVYLGELGSRRGISYDSRRLDPAGQSFVFRAEAAGTYALKFFKQDFVRDYILNDHVQVIIGEAPELSVTGYFNPALDRGRVVAEPRWPTVPEEAELFRRGESNAAGASPGPAAGNAQRPGIIDEGIVPVRPPEASISAPSSVSSGIATSAAASPGPVPAAPAASPGPVLEADSQTAAARPPVPEAPPEQYLQRAQEEFDAGRVAAAIDILDQFREWYPMGSDEAYWLYGQFFEASSPSRDIRLSLDYYRRLVREYPQSRRYNEARRRIAYLERYYINIQ